jgi:hypothetical protein
MIQYEPNRRQSRTLISSGAVPVGSPPTLIATTLPLVNGQPPARSSRFTYQRSTQPRRTLAWNSTSLTDPARPAPFFDGAACFAGSTLTMN